MAALIQLIFEAIFRTFSAISDVLANVATREGVPPLQRGVARGVFLALCVVAAAVVIGLIWMSRR